MICLVGGGPMVCNKGIQQCTAVINTKFCIVLTLGGLQRTIGVGQDTQGTLYLLYSLGWAMGRRGGFVILCILFVHLKFCTVKF